MTTFKKSKAKLRLEKSTSNSAKEVHPFYKISSMHFLESLYLLMRRIQKNSSAHVKTDPQEKLVFDFNLSQLRLFYENIFRIKFTQICKPAIKEFLEKYESKRYSQKKKLRKSAKEKEEKKRKQDKQELQELQKKNGEQKQMENHQIEDASKQDNLYANLFKSVEKGISRRTVTDFLNTKKRIFDESIQSKNGFASPEIGESEFTSPELIDNGIFKNIELTTIKKRTFCDWLMRRKNARLSIDKREFRLEGNQRFAEFVI